MHSDFFRFSPGTVRVITGDGVFLKNSRASYLLPGAAAIELMRRVGPLLDDGLDLTATTARMSAGSISRLEETLVALVAKGLVTGSTGSVSEKRCNTLPVTLVVPFDVEPPLTQQLVALGVEFTHRENPCISAMAGCKMVVGQACIATAVEGDSWNGLQRGQHVVMALEHGDLFACACGLEVDDLRPLFARLAAAPQFATRRACRRDEIDPVLRGARQWLVHMVVEAICRAGGVPVLTVIDPEARTTSRHRLQRSREWARLPSHSARHGAVDALLALADASRCTDAPWDGFSKVVRDAPGKVDPIWGPLTELGESNYLQLPLCRSHAVFVYGKDGAHHERTIATATTYIDARAAAIRLGAARYSQRESLRLREGATAPLVVILPEVVLEPPSARASAAPGSLACGTSRLAVLMDGLAAESAGLLGQDLRRQPCGSLMSLAPPLVQDNKLRRLIALANRVLPGVRLFHLSSPLGFPSTLGISDDGRASVACAISWELSAQRALLAILQLAVSETAGEPADDGTELLQLGWAPEQRLRHAPVGAPPTSASILAQMARLAWRAEYQDLLPVLGLGPKLFCARITLLCNEETEQ